MLGSCGWLSPRGHHNGGSAFLIWKETNQCLTMLIYHQISSIHCHGKPYSHETRVSHGSICCLHKRKWFTLRYHNVNMVCITLLGHLSFPLYVEWVTDCRTQLITTKLWLIRTKASSMTQDSSHAMVWHNHMIFLVFECLKWSSSGQPMMKLGSRRTACARLVDDPVHKEV